MYHFWSVPHGMWEAGTQLTRSGVAFPLPEDSSVSDSLPFAPFTTVAALLSVPGLLRFRYDTCSSSLMTLSLFLWSPFFHLWCSLSLAVYYSSTWAIKLFSMLFLFQNFPAWFWDANLQLNPGICFYISEKRCLASGNILGHSSGLHYHISKPYWSTLCLWLCECFSAWALDKPSKFLLSRGKYWCVINEWQKQQEIVIHYVEFIYKEMHILQGSI